MHSNHLWTKLADPVPCVHLYILQQTGQLGNKESRLPVGQFLVKATLSFLVQVIGKEFVVHSLSESLQNSK